MDTSLYKESPWDRAQNRVCQKSACLVVSNPSTHNSLTLKLEDLWAELTGIQT